jgi:hypothetical protein
MPQPCIANISVFETLKRKYHALNWFQRWFFPAALGAELEGYGADEQLTRQAWAICNAFLNHTWFFQRLIFPFLWDFHLWADNRELNYSGLLKGGAGEANFKAMMSHEDSHGVSQVLQSLHDSTDLLNGEAAEANRNTLVGHVNPFVLYQFFRSEYETLFRGDLAQANYNALLEHAYPGHLSNALWALTLGRRFAQANQGNFEDLLNYSPILFGQQTRELWARIPHYGLTPERFDLIIEIAREHIGNPDEGQIAVRDLLIQFQTVQIHGQPVNLRENEVQVEAYNTTQSTHTESVHKTVSESATRLRVRYGHQLSGSGLNNTIQAFSKIIMALPSNSFKNQAAKRCFTRITASDYSFTDPVSGISTLQLLALSYCAIHDATNRKGSLKDALHQFVEGLYEIQRGNNLSETGIDDKHHVDRIICIAGTFNKPMEKLHGLHPDVTMLIITKQGCLSKFVIVVNEECGAYLNALSKEELQKLKGKDHSEVLEIIWDKISEKISNRIFDEYGSLFPGEKNSSEFLEYIAYGVSVKLNSNNIRVLNSIEDMPSLKDKPQAFFASTSLDTSAELPLASPEVRF